MTYAQEAARQGIELRAVRARTEAEVDQSRALGVTENPPVDQIDWHLEIDADAPREARSAQATGRRSLSRRLVRPEPRQPAHPSRLSGGARSTTVTAG